MSAHEPPHAEPLPAEVPDDGAEGAARRPRRSRPKKVEAEELLKRVADLVAAARPMPLSASAMINKEEVLELLNEAIDRLPDELREARWLRKEREEYLAKMRADGDEILDAARARAGQMVQRTEVVKAAEQRARKIGGAAEAEARRLRLECEDYCDQRLAGFEIVLERTLKTVTSGREKLQATDFGPGSADDVPMADAFFDRERVEGEGP
jgi:cell division septum initiation protein DivIVA